MRALVAFLLFCASLSAFSVCTITWEANPPEENVTHYNVYWRYGSGEFTKSPNIVGTATTDSFVGFDCLAARGKIEATASNAYGESDFSRAVVFGVPAAPHKLDMNKE